MYIYIHIYIYMCIYIYTWLNRRMSRYMVWYFCDFLHIYIYDMCLTCVYIYILYTQTCRVIWCFAAPAPCFWEVLPALKELLLRGLVLGGAEAWKIGTPKLLDSLVSLVPENCQYWGLQWSMSATFFKPPTSQHIPTSLCLVFFLAPSLVLTI